MRQGAAPSLRVGDKAKALWKMGRKFYNVEVVSVNTDGTFSLTYEDGDFWANVPADRITTVDGVGLVPSHSLLPAAAALVGLEPSKLRHSVVEGAVDAELLARVFPEIKSVFVPQVVKYSNTNPDIADEDGGSHGEKIDWKVSSYMEVDTATTPGAAQKNVRCDLRLKHVCQPLLDQCNAVFTSWYERQHGAGSVKELVRLQSFVTRYRPLPNENALLRHIDGAHVDGSIILALPTDKPWSGGGVTVWEHSSPESTSSPTSSLRAAEAEAAAAAAARVAGVAPEHGAAETVVAAAATRVAAASSLASGDSGRIGRTDGSGGLQPRAGTKEGEVAFEYPLRAGDLCLLDNYVWHQGNPITHGERWSLVIFYAVQEACTSRLLNIVKKAAAAKLRESSTAEGARV
eukprot:CAMPEP_0171703688 /NCGR_PEP_ID=MMETSP0991-20121206/12263_1 /TAXON_ID=483369 /ORGANISM="non described non described, Strain CCMP2098" /LENGTH=402 /DNA_ID=CAMNT_0012293115 /DNA_START=64 /DNA_END=1272 /DNA_ORIENTATION=-